jgi:hypothetical protein
LLREEVKRHIASPESGCCGTPALYLDTPRFIPEIANEFAGKCALLEIRDSDENVRRFLDNQIKQLSSFVLRNIDLQEEIKTEIIKAVQEIYLCFFTKIRIQTN